MNSQIDRLELLALLNKGLDYPLVLLVAPPGSGKSVLLEQWQNHLCQLARSPKVMRFETSPKLNEGDVIFSLIFDALKSMTPLWEASFFNLFKDDSQVDEVTLIEVFLEAFTQLAHDLVIIFDDFHHISSARIHRIMNTLVSKLPTHVSILLSSRRYPQFSIAKLKLKEAVLIIDGNDLRINAEELLTLNQSICGSQLETRRISTLLTQTEGWFVGTN